jgi:RND family efflux transporter MFP subunit
MSDVLRLRLRAALILIVLILAAVGLAALGILPKLRAREALRKETNERAAPSVTVIKPERASPAEEVVLPGSIQAYVDAPIYARTNGYLKSWYFDIGARVKHGQLLAEIESPEIDRQLQQARAELGTSQANAHLAQITAERYTNLLKTDSVSKQDTDNAVENVAAQLSSVKSAQANVSRLEQLVSFEKIYAPFNGVITARNTDVGQLIDSGSSGGPARELFHIQAMDKLRVYVSVPQIYTYAAVPGIKADLTFAELPGRRFSGTLVRTADALDPATRTLLVEVDVPNPNHLLRPGAYTEVHFKLKSTASTLLLPVTALIFRAEGLRVGTIKDGNRATLVPIRIGRDFGEKVEVVSGLSENETVVATPPDSLVDGEVVHVVNGKGSSAK